ncbi:hypothetical protein NLU13_2015 [Sarocladium strictum]|uniref:Aminoglycoside phosphotransferase domain-containing protein n=1 Tax=Sarocladium strictum TaxID=5046 RepID=A0AA39GS14_SARSR|nr:hypothetical protein NLU13_2015 [Sarocladium strictum]
MEQPDYSRYLQSIYQDTTWEVERTPHGSINATLRARKTDGQNGPASLVLKHASPYFEDEGSLHPFSLHRQKTEETMLKLWGHEGTLVAAVGATHVWHVPKFFGRDEGSESRLCVSSKTDEASIILMEDIKEAGNLREWIEFMAQSATHASAATECVSRVGHILGKCLAAMHSRRTADLIQTRPEDARALDRTDLDPVTWYLDMDIFPTFLSKEPKAEAYFDRLVEDYRGQKYTYPSCVAHGDFHFGNIILPLTQTPAEQTRPYIIDWEFSTSRGRGVNGDAAQFLGILHCRLISAARQNSASPLTRLLRLLCRKFCEAYRERAALQCSMTAADPNSQLYRSAMLFCGRDMINYANDACAEDDEAFGEMMAVGLWYLEHAGDDMGEFVGQANRRDLANEDEGFIRSLFMFD